MLEIKRTKLSNAVRNVMGVKPKVAMVTSANIEAYLRDVEEFLAGTDPASVLADQLEQAVAEGRLESLTEPERIYYALHAFYLADVNGNTHAFFDEHDPSVWASAETGFRELGPAGLVEAYTELRRRYVDGELEPFSELDSMIDFGIFCTHQLEIEYQMDTYAQEHGFWPA